MGHSRLITRAGPISSLLSMRRHEVFNNITICTCTFFLPALERKWLCHPNVSRLAACIAVPFDGCHRNKATNNDAPEPLLRRSPLCLCAGINIYRISSIAVVPLLSFPLLMVSLDPSRLVLSCVLSVSCPHCFSVFVVFSSRAVFDPVHLFAQGFRHEDRQVGQNNETFATMRQ